MIKYIVKIVWSDSIYFKLINKYLIIYDDDMVLHHTLPVFMGLGWYPIISWDFAGAVSIFGLDTLPVIDQ